MLTLTPPQAYALLEEITGLKDQKLADAVGVSLDTVKRGKGGGRMSSDTKRLYRECLSQYFTEQDNMGFSTAIRKYVVWVEGLNDEKLLFECLDRLTKSCNSINPDDPYEFSKNNVDSLDLKIFDTVTKADEKDSAFTKITLAVINFIAIVDNQEIEPPIKGRTKVTISPSANHPATTPMHPTKTMSLDPVSEQNRASRSASVNRDDVSPCFNLNLLRDVLYDGTSFTSWAKLVEDWHPLIPFPAYEYQNSALYLKRLLSHDVYARLELDDICAKALCNGQPTPALLSACFNLLNNDHYLRIALASTATLVRDGDTYHNLCKAAEIIFTMSGSDPSAYSIFLKCTSWQNSSKALLLLALFALFHDKHYERFAMLVSNK